jgi:hypothetical protein
MASTPNPDPTPDPTPPPDLGDGPSSHDTSPDSVPDPRDPTGEEPSSHETSGADPAAEVRATYVGDDDPHVTATPAPEATERK